MIKPFTSGRNVPIHGAGRWCAPWVAGVALMLAGCQPIVPEVTSAEPTPTISVLAEASPTVTAVAEVSSTNSVDLQAATPISGEATITVAAAISAESVATTTGAVQVALTTPITAGVEISGTLDVTPTSDPAVIAAGLGVYRAAYCGVCHTLGAAGTAGTFGPPHDGIATTAAARVADPNYTGHATTPAGYLFESLLHPEAYYTPGFGATVHRMPPFTHLSQTDLDALVAFLLTQK